MFVVFVFCELFEKIVKYEMIKMFIVDLKIIICMYLELKMKGWLGLIWGFMVFVIEFYK